MATRGIRKKPLAPKFRFPEFVGMPLQALQLKDVTTESALRNGEGPQVGPVMGVTRTDGIVPMEERLIASDIARYKLLRKNWFAYNPMRINIGSIARWQGDPDVLVSPDYVVFRCLEEANSAIEPAYLDYFRQSRTWENFVTEGGGGSVRVRVYYDDLARLELALPSLPEQRKVAACLGSLDDLLSAEQLKLEALRNQKRALMQQMFPRDGETNPRLRFPEFREAQDWTRQQLGSISEILKGRGIAKSDVVEGGETACIRYGELYTIYGEVIDEVVSRTNVRRSDLFLSQAGDVVVPASGETKEDIATCACVVHDGVALGSDLNVIRSSVDGRFLSYYLNGTRRSQLAKVAQGDTVVHLYPAQLQRLEVCTPSEKEEQRRIATCLSSLDLLITAESRKIKALANHRRGLIQQLFPLLERV